MFPASTIPRLFVFAALVSWVVGRPLATAGLITNPGVIDTPTDLAISWAWNPETADALTPNLLNWNVTLRIDDAAPNWSVSLSVQHRVNPHAGESLPAPFVFSGLFPQAQRPVFCDVGTFFNTCFQDVEHPGEGHIDRYRFQFDRRLLVADNRIAITGAHIPEPSTFWLVFPGTMGWALYRIMKARRA